MSWRGIDGGIAAARQGHHAVMTPGSHCYFDYYQGKPAFEPRAIGGYTTLRKVYSYEPIPETLTPVESMCICTKATRAGEAGLPDFSWAFPHDGTSITSRAVTATAKRLLFIVLLSLPMLKYLVRPNIHLFPEMRPANIEVDAAACLGTDIRRLSQVLRIPFP